MPRGDKVLLAVLLAASFLPFLLPGLRTAKFAGVALFGWWLAALMVLAPVLALIKLLLERPSPSPRRGEGKHRKDI